MGIVSCVTSEGVSYLNSFPPPQCIIYTVPHTVCTYTTARFSESLVIETVGILGCSIASEAVPLPTRPPHPSPVMPSVEFYPNTQNLESQDFKFF